MNIEVILKGIKFTPAQQKIVDRFLRGDKLCLVNSHYMNGGEWKWKCEGSDYLDYAGRVHKAFGNILWKIKKAKGENERALFYSFVYAGKLRFCNILKTYEVI